MRMKSTANFTTQPIYICPVCEKKLRITAYAHVVDKDVYRARVECITCQRINFIEVSAFILSDDNAISVGDAVQMEIDESIWDTEQTEDIQARKEWEESLDE